MIKGKLYLPYDNSYCENVETKTSSCITPCGMDLLDKPSDCLFEVVSEPYEEIINILGYMRPKVFINVKSLNTGIVYRTLFSEGNVYSL